MSLEFVPLPSGVGVEIVGLDLRAAQSDNVVAQVLDAFWEHHLVLVRGPEVGIDDQVRFASWFGEIIPPDPAFQRAGYAAVETYMSNVIGEFRITEPYALHRDNTHSPTPCGSMCLHALQVSDHGGETIFVDAHDAFERLPPEVQSRLRGLPTIHIGPATKGDPSFDPDQLLKGFRTTGGTPQTRSSQTWPAVLRHPITNVEVLYVDPATSYEFVGLATDDEECLRREVLSVFEARMREYRHVWSVGDTIVWDNFSLLHGRTAFPAHEKRTLRKLIMGAPVAATASAPAASHT